MKSRWGKRASPLWLAVLLMLVVNQAGPALGVPTEDDTAYKQALEAGNKLLMAKDYAGAKEKFILALERMPYSAPAFYGLGRAVEFGERDFARAESLYLKAIQMAPHWEVPPQTLVGFYRDTKRDPARAAAMFEQLAAGNPRQAAPQVLLGNFHKDVTEQYDKAEKAYLKAIEIDPRLVAPVGNLGNLYMKLRRYNDAERYLKQAVVMLPTDARVNMNLGMFYVYGPREFAKAEQSLRRALELDPKDPLPPLNLGSLLMKQQRIDEAVELYEKAGELAPQWKYPPQALGNVAIKRKQWDKAEQYYNQALALDPRDAVLVSSLGEVARLGRGDLDAALGLYQKALAIDPKLGVAVLNTGLLYRDQKNDPPTALPYFEKAIALSDTDGETFAEYALELVRLKRRQDALGQARRAIKLGFNEPHDAYKELRLDPRSGLSLEPARDLKQLLKIAVGEILLDGKLVAVDGEKHELTMSVVSFTLPNGKTSKLAEPKPKTLMVTEQTLIIPVEDAASLVELRDLPAGAFITMVGVDAGSGKQQTARAIVFRAP